MYAFVRNRGYSPEDSQDLVQQFLVKIIENNVLEGVQQERGRFRSFIRTALARFLKDERQKAAAQKRGGGAWAPCELSEAEKRYAQRMAEQYTPELAYERDWAYALLEQALCALRLEYAGEEREAIFNRLRQFLPGGHARENYREVAGALGISESALKVRIHRLRQRFGQLVRGEVAQTLAAEEELDEELKHLLNVLTGDPPHRGHA